MTNNTTTPTQQALINDKAAVKIFKKLICKKKVYETLIFNTKLEFVIKTVTVKPTSYGSYPNTIVFTVKVLCHYKKHFSRSGEQWEYKKYTSTPYDVRRINRRLRTNLNYLLMSDLRMFSLDYPNVIHSSDIKIEWK